MRRPGTIPPRRDNETDQTIRDRRGIPLGLVRSDAPCSFQVYRLPDGEELGLHHDYFTALAAAFGG
jgi:hypothetical protein